MRRKCSFAVLLLAWLCANGALLDAVQVFAWAKMFTGYAKVMPLSAALLETFDPGKRCELCSAVASARNERADQPGAPSRDEPAKFVLVCAEPAGTLFAPARPAWPETLIVTPPVWRERVPLPPPRA